MLILFMLFLLVAVALILIIRRKQEFIYLLLLCMSLCIYLFGIMLYIAKKGGINRDLQDFLFLSNEIKLMFQYFLITLDRLGLLILIGRVMFPTVLLLISMHFSMIPFVKNNRYLKVSVFLLPVLTFAGYYPKVFRYMSEHFDWYMKIAINMSYAWIIFYIICSMGLLVYEYKEFRFKFWKRYFLYITLFISSLVVMFTLYAKQDPSQVYYFYGNNYLWTGGIYYMNSAMSVTSYVFVVILNLIAAIVGLVSFVKYTRSSIRHDREDMIMERKFDTASIGASAFVHSTKNQLLSNQVVYKRLNKDLSKEIIDRQAIQHKIDLLSSINERLLDRINELHKSVKAKSIEMIPTKSTHLLEISLKKFHDKYPDVLVKVDEVEIVLMVDSFHMAEVIYNILSNAADALMTKYRDFTKGEISIRTYNERLYSVIEISDNGPGIRKDEHWKIFEPFYSSKNSNYNWGMGLHFAMEIVKGHYGTIRFESDEGSGTKFYILLPRY